MGGVLAYKVFRHERGQNDTINVLRTRVEFLSQKVDSLYDNNAIKFIDQVGDGFDYLAIGNSILYHDIGDYWWGEWGMSASAPELDYYHRIIAHLEGKHGTVNSAHFNYGIWEMQGHDREETYTFLDRWLRDSIDLITIQLSENAYDLSTFDSDLAALIKHIQALAPSAQIIVIGDFWDTKKNSIKNSVCSEMNIGFADTTEILGNKDYHAGMDAIVGGNDGKEHHINHPGVAAHPSDKGMEWIADKVIGLIR